MSSRTSEANGSRECAPDDRLRGVSKDGRKRGNVTTAHSRGTNMPEVLLNLVPLNTEGAGNAGRSTRPQPRVQMKKAPRVSHHGHTGDIRHSPRNGFNGFLRGLPGDRAFLPPSPPRCRRVGPKGPTSPQHHRPVDTSVGVSGRHDFAVRDTRIRLVRHRVHRISCPTFCDDRETPLWEAGRREYEFDLGETRNGKFLRRGLDRP